MKIVHIPDPTMQKLVTYLARCPWGDVQEIMAELRLCKTSDSGEPDEGLVDKDDDSKAEN